MRKFFLASKPPGLCFVLFFSRKAGRVKMPGLGLNEGGEVLKEYRGIKLSKHTQCVGHKTESNQ